MMIENIHGLSGVGEPPGISIVAQVNLATIDTSKSRESDDSDDGRPGDHVNSDALVVQSNWLHLLAVQRRRPRIGR